MQQEFDLPPPAPPPPFRPAPPADPGVKRLSLIAAGIGAGLLAMTVLWSFSTPSHHGIPLIEAEPGPVRVEPAHPGGMQVGGGMSRADDATAASALAPPPEVPDITLLHERMQTPSAPSPPHTADQTSEPPAQHAVRAEEPRSVPLPPENPVSRPSRREASKRIRDKTGIKQPERLLFVQLTAARSEDAARGEWARLKRLNPALFADKQPVISRVDHEGRLFYRLRTGGFANTTQAAAFCAHIEKGHGACAVLMK